MDTIFVQIASYRDPELPHTIADCLNRAAHPERLRFGICWQYDAATRDDLARWRDDARFRIDEVDAQHSGGCCWARHRTNRLYAGETFSLQIDAHMRFASDWDERFVAMLARTGADLPVLSTYPPSYTLDEDGKVVLTELDHVPVLKLERLGIDLTTRLGAYPVAAPDTPVPIAFVAAGLLFAPGRFCRDVEYDPDGYFAGEEINLAVRAFSHGYSFFAPDENLVWHLYGHNAPKHWSDNPDTQTERHGTAISRLETLLLGDHRTLGRYGLGDVRSIADFEAQAGIDFGAVKARRDQVETHRFSRNLTLRVDEIPDGETYDLWVFCLLDADGRELYRSDINDPAVLEKRRGHIELDVVLERPPVRYLLWPHSAQGFGERRVYDIDSPVPETPNRFRGRLRLDTSEIRPRSNYEFWVFCLRDANGTEIYRNDISDPAVLSMQRDYIDIDADLPATPTHYMLWPKSKELWDQQLVYPIESGFEEDATPDDDRVDVPEELDESSTIFVAIAAYCEPELKQTLDDCLTKARFPKRLSFGICLQYDNDGPPEIHDTCLDSFRSDPRFRILTYDHRASRGGCWARHLVQTQYRDERYTLQVDAHTRFIEDWDVVLIDMLERLPSGKPLITGFPPLYFIDAAGRETYTNIDHPARVPTTLVEFWAEEGWIHHPTRWIPENRQVPRRTRVLSGAFVFTLGVWNTEVTQDPSHYFTGEEFALTLRSFTHGYDLFNPTRIVVWHRGHPQPNRKHFSDVPAETSREHNTVAYERLRTLLAGDPERKLGCFSLGMQRSLEDYRVFSGLDCTTHTVHPHARIGVPPDPITLLEGADEVETGNLTLYLQGVDPLTVPCYRGDPDVDVLLGILHQRAVHGTGPDQVHTLRFADREVRFRDNDLLSVKVELPG